MDTDSMTKPIRILLVDDHKSFMDGLEMVINSQKPLMKVVGTASNPAETMLAAVEQKPDIILLDISLGTENSLDLLPELLEKTDSKVLILTGLISPEIHDRAIMEGAHGIILKNESAKTIIRAIEKVQSGEIWADNRTLGRVLHHIKPSINNRNSHEISPHEQKIKTLTIREHEIIQALIIYEASTNDEIAKNLYISKSTLKNHLTTIYSKLEVKNRIQLLKFALTYHLVESPH